MKTEVISTAFDPELGANRGAQIILAGGLVAFPTETVYGLGANGLNPDAVRAIYAAKGRPTDNPSILHIAHKEQVKSLWRRVPDAAWKLMDTFWPGPLTLIAQRSDIVPDEVTGGLDTVAVRLPANRTAQLLIERAGVPIAAPSANLSGKPSPTCAGHVLHDMDGRIPLILDGGSCQYGVESTVLSLAGEPTILRPGAITREMLAAVIGEVRVAPSVLSPLKKGEVAASPGMKYKHYAPNAEVVVVSGTPEKAAKKIAALYCSLEMQGKKCEIAATEQTKDFYLEKKYVILGDRNYPETLCASLFASLREMDSRADCILAEGIPAEDAGMAYMNRLLRAAGFHMINV